MNRTSRPRDQIQLEILKKDIAARLARVCDGWTHAEREELVSRIAQNELRFPSGRFLSDVLQEDEMRKLGLEVGHRR